MAAQHAAVGYSLQLTKLGARVAWVSNCLDARGCDIPQEAKRRLKTALPGRRRDDYRPVSARYRQGFQQQPDHWIFWSGSRRISLSRDQIQRRMDVGPNHVRSAWPLADRSRSRSTYTLVSYGSRILGPVDSSSASLSFFLKCGPDSGFAWRGLERLPPSSRQI